MTIVLSVLAYLVSSTVVSLAFGRMIRNRDCET